MLGSYGVRRRTPDGRLVVENWGCVKCLAKASQTTTESYTRGRSESRGASEGLEPIYQDLPGAVHSYQNAPVRMDDEGATTSAARPVASLGLVSSLMSMWWEHRSRRWLQAPKPGSCYATFFYLGLKRVQPLDHVGHIDRVCVGLMRLTRSPFPLPLGSLRARRSLLAVENLLAAIDAVLAAPGTLRRPFIAAESAGADGRGNDRGHAAWARARPPTIRPLANGRERYGMLLDARSPRRR
jgi:hypothetical protein